MEDLMFNTKDLQRVQDIITKSNGDVIKMTQLAHTMAKSIKDYGKAEGRCMCAIKLLGITHPVTEEFRMRAIELNAGFVNVDPKPTTKKVEKVEVVKTETEKDSIYFPTHSAGTIFSWELTGQFSDGYWENTRPSDHWLPWRIMDVKLGTSRRCYSGWICKDNYGISNKDLLDCVGDRMKLYGRMGKAVGEDWKELGSEVRSTIEEFPKEHFNLKEFKTNMIAKKDWRNSEYYWKGLTQEMVDKFYETEYSEKEFKEDLKQIKIAMKTRAFVGNLL